MSDSKVFMFPEQNSNLMSLLGPMLSQKGIDPNILLAQRNNGFGNEGGWFMWVIFLFFLMGWGGNGWNGFGNRNGSPIGAELGNLINNDSGRELLMQAIQGNGTAINQLSSNLNCSIDSVQSALTGLMTQLSNVGNQVGLSVPQIINSIQSGNCQIASKIADCCCENRLATCQQTNTLQNAINTVATGQERGFSSVAYETQKQTCDIRDSIRSATESILAGQRDAEMREMQNKIDALREASSQKDVIINNGQQTAVFNQIIQNATTPLVNALATLQGDVNSVKCKLPETVTLPYSCATAVPTNLLYGYGLSNLNTCGVNTLWG